MLAHVAPLTHFISEVLAFTTRTRGFFGVKCFLDPLLIFISLRQGSTSKLNIGFIISDAQINDRTGYASNSSRRVNLLPLEARYYLFFSAMLNYVTYKYVVLKDFRLGILYYVLVASIVLYTLTEIFFNKGYLHVSGPHRVGAVLLIATVCTTRNVMY